MPPSTTLDAPTPKRLAPLLVVLVVSLAGCTVAGVPIGAPQPYTDTGAALDGDALRAAHTDALHEAGSFAATTNVTLRSDDGAVTVNRTARVDFAANRSLATSRLDGRVGEAGHAEVATYTGNGTTARRVHLAGDDGELVRYDAARAPYDGGLLAVSPVDGTARANGDLVAIAVEEVDWVQRGVERHDGGWVTRYEATGAGNVSDVGAMVATGVTDAELERTGLSADDVEPDEVEATLLVSPDGVVRRLALTVVATGDDGETRTLTLTVSTDGVGSTDVQRPAWYDEATEDLDD